MVLPKLKRYLNAKNTSSDHENIRGHRNLNKTERSVIARYRNLNAPKICKITVPFFSVYLSESLCLWFLIPPLPSFTLYRSLIFVRRERERERERESLVPGRWIYKRWVQAKCCRLSFCWNVKNLKTVGPTWWKKRKRKRPGRKSKGERERERERKKERERERESNEKHLVRGCL